MNSRKRGLDGWTEGNYLWELANPNRLACKSGAPVDDILMAPGGFIPEGVPSTEQERGVTEEGQAHQSGDVSDETGMGKHTALLLDLNATLPGIRTDRRKSDTRSTATEN